MKDYHARFRERFGDEIWCKEGKAAGNEIDYILAFIDEIVRETELAAGYHTGREHERAALIEKVRELTIDGPNIVPYVETHYLLTHLRGEGLCIFHKDKNCCAYDVKQRSGIQEKPFKDLGEFVNAPEEKKRKVMLEVAREATNDQRAQIGLPPLPQSGIQTNYVDSRTPDEKANEPDSVVTTAQSFQEETEGVSFREVNSLFKKLGEINSRQEETECCVACSYTVGNGMAGCSNPDGCCHKPRTEFKKFKEDEANLSKLPRTEEARCKHGYIKLDHCLPEFGEITGIKETEKEGASLSGRGLWVTCEKDYKILCAHWHFEKCDCECHSRPKETTTPQPFMLPMPSMNAEQNRGEGKLRPSSPTPQSREQGGECSPECVKRRKIYQDSLGVPVVGHLPECRQTNQ